MDRPKLVLLDFDGVIVEGSNEAYFDCYRKAVEAVGVDLEPALLRQRIFLGWGGGPPEMLQIILKEHQELVPQAVTAWKTCGENPDFWKGVSVIEGTKEAIDAMAQQVHVGIVSGTRIASIEKMLERGGITTVSKVWSSDDVASELKKPHPHTLKLALDHFGQAPQDTIYVGDMVNDIKMARAAGARPVAVLTGGLDEQTAREQDVEFIGARLLEVAQTYFS